MFIALTGEQESIRDAVKKICDQFGDDYRSGKDERKEFPHEFHAAMAEGGWLGITHPAPGPSAAWRDRWLMRWLPTAICACCRSTTRSSSNGACDPKIGQDRAVGSISLRRPDRGVQRRQVPGLRHDSVSPAAILCELPCAARALGKKDLVTITALQISTSLGREVQMSEWDGSCVPNTRNAARRAYAEAGITDPRSQLSLTEVHDCFSITELVTMEDLFLSEDGLAVGDILNGRYDRDGAIPCQIDGGLKCFGHPVAASGLRMAYEVYTQLLGNAGARQLSNPSLGLRHNLGGVPYQGVAAISILGLM